MMCRAAICLIFTVGLSACGSGSRNYPNQDYVRCDIPSAYSEDASHARKTERICSGRAREAQRVAERGPRRYQWF